jgi:hypothetical protein
MFKSPAKKRQRHIALLLLIALVCASGAAGAAFAAFTVPGVPLFSPNGSTAWLAPPGFLIPSRTGPKSVMVDPAHPFNPGANLFTVVDTTNPNLQPRVADVLKTKRVRLRYAPCLEIWILSTSMSVRRTDCWIIQSAP